MKGTHEFLTIKQSIEASMEAMRTLLGKVQGEVDTLEQQKAVLAVEVQNITRGLEPARKEAAGQQAEVDKAYERSRQARVGADAEIAKIKADVEHWEKKKVTAKAEAEAEHTKVMLAKQNELDVLEEKIANAEKKIRDLKNKIAKDL